MLNRRQFLVSGGASLGAWSLGARLARVICELAEDHQPYLVEVDRPEHTLYATLLSDEYIFTLDSPYLDMEDPKLSWREWLTIRGVRNFREKDIRELLVDRGWLKPEESKLWVPPHLDEPLPQDLLQEYLDWDYAIYDAPTALAFHYLKNLHLANRRVAGDALGSLAFVEGTRPGCNDCLALTRGVAVLGGLQQRLLELGQEVRIVEESV